MQMLRLRESDADMECPKRWGQSRRSSSLARCKELSQEHGWRRRRPSPARGHVPSSGSNSLGPESSDSLETSQGKRKMHFLPIRSNE